MLNGVNVIALVSNGTIVDTGISIFLLKPKALEDDTSVERLTSIVAK